jgi:hypothetical protein
MRNCPFDKLYLTRQLLHGSKRLSEAFPNNTIGIQDDTGNFSNLIFILAIDGLEGKTFGNEMKSILGDSRAVWQFSDTVHGYVPAAYTVPVELMYLMVPDPKVRDWLLDMNNRKLLEEI